jgi:hypothetical protein
MWMDTLIMRTTENGGLWRGVESLGNNGGNHQAAILPLGPVYSIFNDRKFTWQQWLFMKSF